jgi:hypothetical protein
MVAMSSKRQWFSLVKQSSAAAVAAVALLGQTETAEAQARFGDRGQLAIAGENLFTLGTERYGHTVVNTEASETINRFGFLYSQCGASPRCPQVSGHYFIIPSLSIGGAIGYESRGGSQTAAGPNGALTTNLPDESSFLVLPQVGYAFMFGQVVGFWLRGGIGYFHQGSTNASDSYWLLSGNGDLVVSPFQHFAFYVGPQFDLSFTGSQTNTGPNGVQQSTDASFRDFGLGVGLIGYVDL